MTPRPTLQRCGRGCLCSPALSYAFGFSPNALSDYPAGRGSRPVRLGEVWKKARGERRSVVATSYWARPWRLLRTGRDLGSYSVLGVTHARGKRLVVRPNAWGRVGAHQRTRPLYIPLPPKSRRQPCHIRIVPNVLQSCSIFFSRANDVCIRISSPHLAPPVTEPIDCVS